MEKNIGTRKSEFVTETQFLWPAIPTNKQNIEEFCRHTLSFHWYNKCKMSSIFFHLNRTGLPTNNKTS